MNSPMRAAPAARTHARKAWMWIACGALFVLVTGTALRAIPDTAPESDHAVIDLQILEGVRGWQPVGMYSRFGWHHPGPLYFQALTPLYVVSGFRHTALIAGVVAINLISVLALIRLVTRRCTHIALPVAVCALFSIYFLRLAGLFASTWTPHAALVPFGLLLVCAAAVLSGDAMLLPIVVLLVSFVAQTHMGYAPAAVVAGALAIGAVSVRAYRPGARGQATRQQGRRALLWTGVVLVLAWWMPLVDEFRPSGWHNFQELARYFAQATPFDPRRAARAFEHLIVAPFTPGLALDWGHTPLPRSEPIVRALVFVQLVGLVGTSFLAWRRRARFEASLALVCLACSLAGLIAVRRLPEEVHDYTVLWVTMIGVLAWAVTLAEALYWLARASRRPFSGRPAIAVAMTGIGLVVLACTARDVRHQRALDLEASPRIHGLARLIEADLRTAPARRPFVHVPQDFWGVATGVVLQLSKDGLRPVVDADWITMFGEACKPGAANTGAEFVFVRGEQHVDTGEHRLDDRLLGQSGDISVYRVRP